MVSDNLLVPTFRFSLLVASPFPNSNTTSTSALYRGSLPLPHNIPFLKTLNLKTIISLTPKPLNIYELERLNLPLNKRRKIITEGINEEEELITTWCKKKEINLIHIKSDKSKDGSLPFNSITVKKVLELLITEENLPIYIHDLDGSDVLGIIGASLRKLMGWNEASYIDELSRFLRVPPAEPAHLTFIKKLFNPIPSSSSISSHPPIITSTQSHPNILSSNNINGGSGGGGGGGSTTTILEDPNSYILIPNSSKRSKWFYLNGSPNYNGNGSNSNLSTGSNIAIGNSNYKNGGNNILILGGMRVKFEPEEILLPTTSTPTSSILNESNSTTTITRGEEEGEIISNNGINNNLKEVGILNSLMLKEIKEGGGMKNLKLGENQVSSELIQRNDGKKEGIEGEEEEDEEEEEEEEEDEEEEVIPLSQMIDALDLGL